MTVWDMDCVFLKHLIRGSLNSGIGKYNGTSQERNFLTFTHTSLIIGILIEI